MRYTNMMRAGAVLIIPLAIAACSGRSNDPVQEAPPPGTKPPVGSIQSQISTGFAASFDASNATDAKDPTPADLPPLSLTTEPVAG